MVGKYVKQKLVMASIIRTLPHPQPLFPQDADAKVMESSIMANKFMMNLRDYVVTGLGLTARKS